MEKRRVTITVGGQPYSFASDDPDEYIRTLEKRTNAALKETAEFAPSAYAGAILAVISQTDRLLREEQAAQMRKTKEPDKSQTEKVFKKEPARKKVSAQEKGQVSVWDLLEEAERMPETAAEAAAPAGQAERMPEMPTKVGSPVGKSNTAAIDRKHSGQTKSARKDQL
ncbi:MAG: cell division protein ZapA [Clostridia bacterium]